MSFLQLAAKKQTQNIEHPKQIFSQCFSYMQFFYFDQNADLESLSKLLQIVEKFDGSSFSVYSPSPYQKGE